MNSLTHKKVTIKLFFNLSDRSFYVQLGDTLFRIRDTIASAIQERENLEIRHVADTKQMQMLSLEDEKIKP